MRCGPRATAIARGDRCSPSPSTPKVGAPWLSGSPRMTDQVSRRSPPRRRHSGSRVRDALSYVCIEGDQRHDLVADVDLDDRIDSPTVTSRRSSRSDDYDERAPRVAMRSTECPRTPVQRWPAWPRIGIPARFGRRYSPRASIIGPEVITSISDMTSQSRAGRMRSSTARPLASTFSRLPFRTAQLVETLSAGIDVVHFQNVPCTFSASPKKMRASATAISR